MSQGRSLRRTYNRKLENLAALFANEMLQKKATPDNDHYKSRFKEYNNKWIEYCKGNRRQSQVPDLNDFKKYIELCQ